ncbi:hypothetical protein BGP_3918 [Beggiatoa sp. PS]|nr:hypothetical protein BGP_3918 [Beggiatoa sp. PS]
MFASVANKGIGIVKNFDGKEHFLYLQVDNEYAFRISGDLLIHFDTGRFIILFNPIENSQRLIQALINGNSLFFGAWEEDDFIFTSTYSLQGFTKALLSTIDACKTIGNE